ncbi:hypothetical protein P3T23_008444 [Paraburkholderia sp. GAS448]|uniref:glycine zipper family protein n=1 Tax=Paraburkholderia sp. GAS448 TaxID=3035136 RepID=UPI003D1A9C4A
MKNNLIRPVLALGVTVLLCSCASTPPGPTVQVLPGQTVPFEAFRQDQDTCRQYAASEVAGQADRANASAIGAALLTTALGAAFGAATSWHGHAAGAGAAFGATAGTAIGAGTSSNAQMGIQMRYDNAYAQCMYAKGNLVAGMAPARYAPAY